MIAREQPLRPAGETGNVQMAAGWRQPSAKCPVVEFVFLHAQAQDAAGQARGDWPPPSCCRRS